MIDVYRIDASQAGPPPEPANFVGEVRMQNLHGQAGATSVEVLAVHFSAGARTRPHTHPGEQILVFARGSGFVHMAGEEERRVPEGGIVIVPAGVVHMHGATDEEPIVHVAIRAANGATNWKPDGVPGDWARFTTG